MTAFIEFNIAGVRTHDLLDVSCLYWLIKFGFILVVNKGIKQKGYLKFSLRYKERIQYLNIVSYFSFDICQCRDEGPLRARVKWYRGGDLPFPIQTQDVNGRLEMPSVQMSHTGTYICKAVDYENLYGSSVSVYLRCSWEKFWIIFKSLQSFCWIKIDLYRRKLDYEICLKAMIITC